MRVLLVNMPWTPIDVPSLALGILERAVRTKVPGAEVEVVHANLDYVDWITENYRFTLHDYQYYALATYFIGLGDWVFSSALYDDPGWRLAEMEERIAHRMTPEELAMNRDLHASAPEFVRWLADRLAERVPDVVGFTSTYQQNVAALAVARQVKARSPRTATIFGGANCDGAQGEALHRNFPFVDFVVRGEGEASFPQFLTALGSGGSGGSGPDFAPVPGLCWREGSGRSVANPMSTRPLPPADIVMPSYDGYFERLEESVANTWVEPKLVVEGARGCWWGEKHHCTFCGLNGSFMQFRSKSPSTFFDEIISLVERHQVLDMFVVDNILDMGYLTSLLPAIIESGYDLRLQYEIKSNLRRHQLQTLADAGLVHVQPGIENLNSRVLALMDKGVSGCQNVRILRDGVAAGITVSWNYLYGFPGESDDDYDPVVVQVPALHHLEPCGASTRIVIERFSPYFNRPELGFGDLRPAGQYAMTYDLPDRELFELAYLFESAQLGIGEATAERLEAALDEWRAEHPHSRLSYCDLGTEIVLVSRRRHFDWSVLTLADPVELATFRLLDQPHSVPALARKLRAQVGSEASDAEVSDAGVAALLDRWRGLGLIYTDGGQFIQVAPPVTNQELLHTEPPTLPEPATGSLPAEPGPPAGVADRTGTQPTAPVPA